MIYNDATYWQIYGTEIGSFGSGTNELSGTLPTSQLSDYIVLGAFISNQKDCILLFDRKTARTDEQTEFFFKIYALDYNGRFNIKTISGSLTGCFMYLYRGNKFKS